MLRAVRCARSVTATLLVAAAGIVAPSNGAVALSAEARASASDIASWDRGYAVNGRLGYGSTALDPSLDRIGSTRSWTPGLAGFHACVTHTNHTLWCWGYNYYGEIGDRTTTNRHTPTRVGYAGNWATAAAVYANTVAPGG